MPGSTDAGPLDRPNEHQSGVLASVWRHPFLVVACGALGLGIALGLTTIQPADFQAESRVFLSSHEEFDPTGQRGYGSDPSRFVEQQAAVMTSTPVLEAALKAGAPAANVGELREVLDVAPSAESDLVAVRASAATPAAAEAIVDQVVLAYRARVSNHVAAIVRQIEDVLSPTDRQSIRKQAALFGDGVSLVEPAAATQVSSTVRNTVLLGLIGLLLGIGLALGMDRLPSDRTAGWARRRLARPAGRPLTYGGPTPTPAVASERGGPAVTEAS